QMVADFCEEALAALEADSGKANVVALEDGKRETGERQVREDAGPGRLQRRPRPICVSAPAG
ncbi:hypothetical protein ABTP66_19500, partial [Acinetobacter baumannii]